MIQGIVYQGVDWFHLACEPDKCLDFVDTVMNLRVSRGEFLDALSGYQLLTRFLLHTISYQTLV
jgi:hypothetical protein